MTQNFMYLLIDKCDIQDFERMNNKIKLETTINTVF